MSVPPMNPKKLPQADFKPVCVLCPEDTSPMYAPINGPNTMEKAKVKKDKIKPTIKPMLLPRAPDLVPPKYLVVRTGRKKSRMVIISITMPKEINQ